MRILLLCEGDAETLDSWSGSSKSVVDGLRAAGHTVHCGDVDLSGAERWLTLARTFSPGRRRWWVKYHLAETPFRRRSARAARHVERLRGELDLVLQIGATSLPAGLDGLPLVLYCDSNILLASRAADPTGADSQSLSASEIEGVRARETTIYRSADAILTMSERLRGSFVEDFGIAPERVHTIHAGANLDPERIPATREATQDTPPTVLFVGRDFERKGGRLLLRVFERVRRALPDAQLVIVGPPDAPVAAPGVRCLGFLDKNSESGWRALVDAYATADVFFLPTRFEPFGIAFVEAMYFGLPCVGPDSWAVPEIIGDGETGFVVPPDDETAFAERLVALLRDRALARAMGSAGRERAATYFTWPATIRRMVGVFEDVLRGGGGDVSAAGTGREAQ